jgi:hypothetical protein
MREHALSMVARGNMLDHGRASGRMQPRKQHGGFHLRRGDGEGVDDRDEVWRAPDGEWEGRPIDPLLIIVV